MRLHISLIFKDVFLYFNWIWLNFNYFLLKNEGWEVRKNRRKFNRLQFVKGWQFLYENLPMCATRLNEYTHQIWNLYLVYILVFVWRQSPPDLFHRFHVGGEIGASLWGFLTKIWLWMQLHLSNTHTKFQVSIGKTLDATIKKPILIARFTKSRRRIWEQIFTRL